MFPSHDPGGYYLKLNNNTVNCFSEGVAIDVNPATGWVDAGSADLIAGTFATRGLYTHLTMLGNIIYTDDAAPIAPTTYPFYGVVRLWHPSGSANGPSTANMHYLWNICNNQLINSTIIADANASGSDLLRLEFGGAGLGLTFGQIQAHHNFRVVGSTVVQDDLFGITNTAGDAYSVLTSQLLVTDQAKFTGTAGATNHRS